MPLPRIGTATANLARTVTAPAVAPISQAVGVLRNPIQAMDLPPAIGVAGQFARDVTGGGMPSFARAFEGVMRKSENKLDSVAQNTQSTAAGVVGVLGSTASMETYLQAGFESMVELLGEIERNTRGPSEEEIMESKRDKNAAQAKGAGPKPTKTESKGLFDFNLFDAVGGMLTLMGGMSIAQILRGFITFAAGKAFDALKFIFSPKGLLKSVLSFLNPVNLLKMLGRFSGTITKVLGRLLFGATGAFARTFLAIPIALYQFFEGFLREMFADSDDSFLTKALKGIGSGLIEILDTFTFGLMGEENKQKLIKKGHELVDGFMEWWETFSFKDFIMGILDGLPSISEMIEAGNNLQKATNEWASGVNDWLKEQAMAFTTSFVDYFMRGEGVGYTKLMLGLVDAATSLFSGGIVAIGNVLQTIGTRIAEYAMSLPSFTPDIIRNAIFDAGVGIATAGKRGIDKVKGTEGEGTFGDQFPAGIEAARSMGVDFAAPGSPQADPSQAVLDAVTAGLAASGGNNQVKKIRNGETYVERMNPWIGPTSWEGGGR